MGATQCVPVVKSEIQIQAFIEPGCKYVFLMQEKSNFWLCVYEVSSLQAASFKWTLGEQQLLAFLPGLHFF